MRKHGIVGEVLLPMLSESVIRVILQVELGIFIAAAAEHLDMPRRICNRRQHPGFLQQAIDPEMAIELAVGEVICLLDKHLK